MTPTLTLDEAAAVLKTHPDTVADCIAHRGLPAVKVGRAWVLVLDDVIGWLRTQYPTNKETPECASTNAASLAPGGLTSAKQEASALAAALAPRTGARRRKQPPALRTVSGGSAGSAKPRA